MFIYFFSNTINNKNYNSKDKLSDDYVWDPFTLLVTAADLGNPKAQRRLAAAYATGAEIFILYIFIY